MRKITILAIVLCTLFTGIAFASDDKPRAAVLYYNNLNWRPSTNAELQDKFLQRLTSKFSLTHEIIIDEQYKTKLKKVGMEDLTTTERGDIIPIFKPDGIRYIIIIDMLPKISKYSEWNADKVTSSLYLKVIDVEQNKTLYNGKFSNTSRVDTPTTHINKLYTQVEETLIRVLQ